MAENLLNLLGAEVGLMPRIDIVQAGDETMAQRRAELYARSHANSQMVECHGVLTPWEQQEFQTYAAMHFGGAVKVAAVPED